MLQVRFLRFLNDIESCVQWCKYAKECVGEEMYNKLMARAKKGFLTKKNGQQGIIPLMHSGFLKISRAGIDRNPFLYNILKGEILCRSAFNQESSELNFIQFTLSEPATALRNLKKA